MHHLAGVIDHRHSVLPVSKGRRIVGYFFGAAWYVGLGLGAAEVDAQIFLLDGKTKQRLQTERLRALLTGGVFGGREDKITNELARRVRSTGVTRKAKTISLMLAVVLLVRSPFIKNDNRHPSPPPATARSNLRVEITNTGKLSDATEGSSALGLDNARERLRLMYGDSASLTLAAAGECKVRAVVVIPLHSNGLPS